MGRRPASFLFDDGAPKKNISFSEFLGNDFQCSEKSLNKTVSLLGDRWSVPIEGGLPSLFFLPSLARNSLTDDAIRNSKSVQRDTWTGAVGVGSRGAVPAAAAAVGRRDAGVPGAVDGVAGGRDALAGRDLFVNEPNLNVCSPDSVVTGFYWVLPGFTGLLWVVTRF